MGGHPGGSNLTAVLGWRLKRLRLTMQRVHISLRQRGLRGTLARIGHALRRQPSDDQSLDLLPLDDAFTPFSVPTDDSPVVSVIIPVHGQLAWTLACLRSITRHPPVAAFEVIVVDDASPDASAEVLTQVGGLRLLRNPQNLGFVGSCNAGAAAARGTHLLFLNNDTQVTPGWLDQLLVQLRTDPACGIAGSRLLYPDGRLQEAGALIFANGRGWNVGRFAARHDPRYRWRREADYVSGAALMIARDLFDRVGGFDARYAPAYYEDADLAFAVRAAGKRVMVVPASSVVHYEGITGGTDPTAGVKQSQQRNLPAFTSKWAKELASQPAQGTPEEQAMHRQRRRMLMIESVAPEPTRDSGSFRLFALCQVLQAQGWDVAFHPADGVADAATIDALGALGVEVLCRPWVRDAPTWLRTHGAHLQAAMLWRRPVAELYLPLIRRHAPQALVIFDTGDLHFLREQRAAQLHGDRALLRHAAVAKQRELQLINASDVTLVVSPMERDLLAEVAPHARVEILSNVHPVHGRGAPFSGRRDVVFIGGFAHPPNADALAWLAKDIMPRLRARAPHVRLHVLGDMPVEARRLLAVDGIDVHGRVDDLKPWMDGCRVALAPLRFGAGVKGKVNMAMSHGLPVVATSIAAEGMYLHDGEDVLVADDSETFVDAVLRVYHDEALWLRLSEGGLANVREHFSAAAADRALHLVLDAIPPRRMPL